jgi:hypothetical protein
MNPKDKGNPFKANPLLSPANICRTTNKKHTEDSKNSQNYSLTTP